MNRENLSSARADALRRQARRIGKLYSHLLLYLVILAAVFFINALTTPDRWWALWVAFAFGLATLLRVWNVFVTPRFTDQYLEKE